MKWTRIGVAAFVGALAIGLALSLGLWSQWTASAQDTFIVNDDTAPATDGCDTPDFQTEDIQDAIDSGLVADGDTLVICEGTYNPPNMIEVTKVLTIEGRAAADRDDILIQGTWLDGFVISVDGVTIRHLKLVGAGNNAAIHISSGADNNTIQDIDATAYGVGILIAMAEGNVVETSSIHANLNLGIQVQDGGGNTIRNNEITDNQFGVGLTSEDGDLVEGNTISGNTVQQVHLFLKVNARIERNNITASSDGINISQAPAGSLVIIGGSPDKANTFTGPFGGSSYYVELQCDGENTVDATYNWWGSTNRTDIANRIFNDEDNIAECPAPDDLKGAVVFHPWATGPAPTATPTPTPSPTATPTATGTPTPTATPGATRTINLSPAGWHDLAWSGADATDPGTALACIAGKYSIAYAWEGPTAGFKRHVEGCAIPGICNMAALNKYDTMLVNITATGASCVMPDEGSGPPREPLPSATLVTGSGEQSAGVGSHCWEGLCVDVFAVIVPSEAVTAQVDEPVTFELSVEPTSLGLAVWAFDSGDVVDEQEGFLVWLPGGEPSFEYPLPAQSSLEFTPDFPPGLYVIALDVGASAGSVTYGFQLEVLP